MLIRCQIILIVSVFMVACGNDTQPTTTPEIVETPEQMNSKVHLLISEWLKYARGHEGVINDSLRLVHFSDVGVVYSTWSDSTIWNSATVWKPQADSILDFIRNCRQYGLYPGDYHLHHLEKIKKRFELDSLSEHDRRDASLWSQADLMLTDALIGIMHDVKLGRLPADSITMRKDSILHKELLLEKVKYIAFMGNVRSGIESLEPAHTGYRKLKDAIPRFIAGADFTDTFQIKFPDPDKLKLRTAILKRLFLSGYTDSVNFNPDSSLLAAILKKYQQDHKLTADGKFGVQTAWSMNLTDAEKFKRISITLDRYKMLPSIMPDIYLWANIPAYELRLIKNDTVLVSSRIVVGKPITRTPVLTSSIYEMITYPQWNIPQSIIVKEILPALKKDPGYLERKGYSLLDGKGEVIDPYSVNWDKYSKGIPYRIIQGSGDANALGVLKFNFHNKYSVYMHDTNQRSFFSLDSRALSHGCVRVQEWEKIAYFILDLEDEKFNKQGESKLPVPVDSLKHWLVIKEKHVIPLRTRVPVYIRYFTCEAKDGKIIFYEDIYSEDKELSGILYSGKSV